MFWPLPMVTSVPPLPLSQPLSLAAIALKRSTAAPVRTGARFDAWCRA
jgi:hypothetical protein